MGDRGFRWLLAFCLFGFAHWFFGNLYEAVVLGPNMLGPDWEGLRLWRQFSRNSNPISYFLPLNPLSIAALLGAVLAGRRRESSIRRALLTAALFALVAFGITMYLVTRVNVEVYFGPMVEDEARLSSLMGLGRVLSLARLASEAVVLVATFRAYTLALLAPAPPREG